jgi:hypothetical protein
MEMRLAFACALLGLLGGSRARATEFVYVHGGDGGRTLCGAAPAGWEAPAHDDRDWAIGSVDAGACAGTLFVRWRFDVGAELPRLALTTLRIRYEHGFAATLNGVEIARRRLDPGADAAALATEPHGPEAERVFVPLRAGMLRPTGNVLAVEVHPRTAGRTPVVDVELSGTDGARIVRGPYLQRLSEREVTVVFDTDLPTLGEVRWGATEEYGAINTDAPPQLHHALRMGGLQPGTQYHYRVTARGAAARTPLAQVERAGAPLEVVADVFETVDATFHTPPSAGRPLRFVVYGDVRNGHDVHAQLNRAILDEDPDLVLLTGDLVDRGSDEGDWERYFEVAADLLRQVAIFPAVGNHEYARLGRGVGNFLALFRWPLRTPDEDGFYSFDAAGVHFIALDSQQYRSPRQLAWLERDLVEARRRGARAVFAYAHEGPWSTGMHGDNSDCIHDYVPLLERYKVAMLFSGHDHDYERGRVGALDYVVSGGGGAELRAPRCEVVPRGAQRFPGVKACPPHVAAFANEHHYVLVEVLGSFFRVCAKRPDGTPLESCVDVPLRR